MTRPWWLGLLLLASPTLHLHGLNTPFPSSRVTSWPSPLELPSWQQGVSTLDRLGGQAQLSLAAWIQSLHSESSEHCCQGRGKSPVLFFSGLFTTPATSCLSKWLSKPFKVHIFAPLASA